MKKWTKVSISILLILLFVLPNSQTWAPWETGSEEAPWANVYILGNIELLIMYLPFAILGLFSLLLKGSKYQIWCYRIFVFLSALLALNTIGAMIIPLQDFSPSYGVALSFLFFPILVLDWLLRGK